MRQLLLIFFAFSCFSCLAQNKKASQVVLQVEEKESLNLAALSFKLEKKIKIKTLDGRKLLLVNYSFVGDSAIASTADTIAINDIASIKGNVKGNALRKASGVILASAGAYFTLVGVFVGVVSVMNPVSPLIFLLPLPAVGVTYIGHELAGARRFNTAAKWSLSISHKK